MKRNWLIGLGLLVSTPALADPSCLEISQIYNWKAPDNKTLIVEDNWHHKYKLSLMGYCPNLTWRQRVAFKSIGGTELSCLGKGDEVDVRGWGIPARCPITNIVPYTPQMEQADKAAAAAAKAQQQNSP